MSEARQAAKNGERAAAGLLDNVKDRLDDLVEETKEKSEDFIAQARERGTRLMEEAQKRGQIALRNAGSWVSQNPGKAIGIAFVAGVVLHALYSRED